MFLQNLFDQIFTVSLIELPDFDVATHIKSAMSCIISIKSIYVKHFTHQSLLSFKASARITSSVVTVEVEN